MSLLNHTPVIPNADSEQDLFPLSVIHNAWWNVPNAQVGYEYQLNIKVFRYLIESVFEGEFVLNVNRFLTWLTCYINAECLLL